MIELINVNKTFSTKQGIVHAVQNVNLTIETGDIYGIIGYSGAGKSTLVRCINLLERPESGEVKIDGEDLMLYPDKQLRQKRHKIGMIFQHFNLLSARTVFENVAFPLQYQQFSKSEIREKVESLLELVGLADKANAYPSQLSGGQKQRVAIARALANDPTILLCDEATSALDPQTTQSILTLLKDLNKKLQLTIVIITHEMHVVKSICNKVAIMDKGHVVEKGSVLNVFVQPQQEITKDFINSVNNMSKIDDLLAENSNIVKLEDNQRLIRFDFYGQNTKEALIAEASLQFGIKASIIFADVDIVQETIIGSLVVIIEGDIHKQRQALEFLSNQQIRVEVLKNADNLRTVGA
ncbi:methionine ABC transporter ATP-binding protein [Fundicoccus culcitae]|uniref:Methionine ABC transporter ATP-binding protein n=1 Tax=Fundicoccus culcitae TaxID=2969821 RepID=A0ABY5P6Y2_9LACT|nr:methionine ABC transporter ATP-binding protein [Fundicoccus culcitae]UUX34496.1 methionine ABC transporter ATP-binding protein [Fundicoccus culcitae]